MPLLQECIDSLGEATIFPILDAENKYCQIKVEYDDKYNTVFALYCKLARLIRMLSGLHNSHGTFQRTMDVTLTSIGRQFSLLYFDDTVVFSRALGQHI